MVKLITLACFAGLLSLSQGSILNTERDTLLAAEAISQVRRALPNSPNGYTPSRVDCPSVRPAVRSAGSLSQNETSWIEKRRNNTFESMKDLLSRLNITGFDAESYIQSHVSNASALPNIGIAMSGGGYRALQNGAGVLAAFDNRTENSTNSGHVGGLLQSATYLTGLSGGGWLVGSLFMNNFTTVTALRDDTTSTVWEFGNSLLDGPESNGIQILNQAQYYSTLSDETSGKKDAGFEVTITDVYGRALSFQLINGTDGGPAYTWSSIALAENFQNGETPFPILTADERAPGEILVSSNTTIYEFNPFEMGTWDPTAYGFVPTQYLGSNFTAGSLPADEQCVVGFDNGGFVMGTSATLFNQIILGFNNTSLPSAVQSLLSNLLGDISGGNEDIADYSPNPFYNYNSASNPNADTTVLTLVDGGEDLQNLPLHPLIQPFRGVDVIFAIDSSADNIYHWPNGTAMVATYERNLPRVAIANGTVFPSIPDQNTFVNLGLNTRPTFFGCDANNITSDNLVPLVVYIPNAPYMTFSNVSTLDLKYNDTQRNTIIQNGYDVATMGNGTVDADWPTCLGCAILSRSLDRTGTTVPKVCTTCFQNFCWNGTVNSTTPADYAPTFILDGVKITGATGAAAAGRSVSTLAVVLGCVVAVFLAV